MGVMRGVASPSAARPATAYTIRRTVSDGIERVVFEPEERRFTTPLLFVHGMWHGAWCWEEWQALFAEWGWQSTAFSLPGHGGSPPQRPLRWCNMSYYLEHVHEQAELLHSPPVLVGHSMGAALGQWYLARIGDLPAMCWLAPWYAREMISAVANQFRVNFRGALASILTLSTTPCVQTSEAVAKMFFAPDSEQDMEAFQRRLGPESLLVLLEHCPPFWRPRIEHHTPLLWISGEKDVLIDEEKSRRSAGEYGADYLSVPNAGHNLMMERSGKDSARSIHEWLLRTGIR